MKSDKKKNIDDLIKSYDRFLPHKLFNLLGKQNIVDVKLGDQTEKEMTILFTDIRNFTTLSENMSPQENFNFINSYLRQMEPVITSNNGIIDKFIGDAIMALFPGGPDDALSAAVSMLDQLVAYNLGRKRAGYEKIQIGIGLNSGYLMLGTVGSEKRMEGTVIGDAVNLASRLESSTKAYGSSILISEHTYHNLQNRRTFFIRFIDRIKVKGKAQPISIYEVFDNDSDELRELKIKHNQLFDQALAYYHYKKIDTAEKLIKEYLAKVPKDIPAQIYYKRCKTYAKTGHHECASELGSKITWSAKYEIGLEEIDNQHRNLVETSYRLIEAVETNQEKSKIDEIIIFLSNYVVTHFQTEEQYMKELQYPFYGPHKRLHTKFVQEFTRLKSKIENYTDDNKIYLLFRIQILVIDWVLNHTLKEDWHFGKFYEQAQKAKR